MPYRRKTLSTDLLVDYGSLVFSPEEIIAILFIKSVEGYGLSTIPYGHWLASGFSDYGAMHLIKAGPGFDADTVDRICNQLQDKGFIGMSEKGQKCTTAYGIRAGNIIKAIEKALVNYHAEYFGGFKKDLYGPVREELSRGYGYEI